MSDSHFSTRSSPIDLDDITKEFQRYKSMLSSESISSDKEEWPGRQVGLREMLDSERADTGFNHSSTPVLSHIHLPTTSESTIKDYELKMERRRSV